jgi:hypothetical protein
MHFFTEQVPPVEEGSCYHAVNYTAVSLKHNEPQKTTYTLVHQIIHSLKFLISKILVLNLTKITELPIWSMASFSKTHPYTCSIHSMSSIVSGILTDVGSFCSTHRPATYWTMTQTNAPQNI